MLTDTARLAGTAPDRAPRNGRAGVLGIYDRSVDALAQSGTLWLNGLILRFAFASVLLVYYFNSSWGSLDGSLLNILSPNDGAYAAMLPPIMEEYGYDKTEVPTFPWAFIVTAGVAGELLLPIAIVAGFFTRVAAFGMIVVVAVQTWVDIAFHGLEEKSIGAMFDRLPDAVILDQRLLWVSVLALLVINGPGALSLDRLMRR